MARDDVLKIRCSAEQKKAWFAAAGDARELSGWVRKALDDQAALDSALGTLGETGMEGRAFTATSVATPRPVSPSIPRIPGVAPASSFVFKGPDPKGKP